MSPVTTLTIPKPDDWHVHLRDGDMLRAVLPYTARHFARAVVMPNLKPPITTSAQAKAYRDRIIEALPAHTTFTPLMTAYLTDVTDPEDLERGFSEDLLFAGKLYPSGTTTNSDKGVTDVQAISLTLDHMQKIGMPLLIHGEVADPDVDFFDRVAVFIDRVLTPLRRSFPELKIVIEHITTKHAAQYVASEAQNGKLGATITAHHLILNRNAMFEGGIHPHHFCLPVLKSEDDRQAIILAATSGAPMFMAGTDSAPHLRTNKETATGAGGIFSAPSAVCLYAEVFEQFEALDRLEDFLSLNGAAFHNLPVNAASLTLEKVVQPAAPIKPILTEKGAEVVVFPSDRPLRWRVVER